MHISGRDISLYFLGRLSSELGTPDLLPFVDELLAEPDPQQDLEAAVKDVADFRRKSWKSVFDLGLYRVALYALVRCHRPRVVVETGVLHGITTNFILSAIRRNGSGKLMSVDLPSYAQTGPANKDGYNDTLPPGKEPGWVIPVRNRACWELHLGSSAEVLPRLSTTGGQALEIDMFLHDSEHTYATMQAELRWAWAHLRNGGLLVCDNIDANDAFADFARENGIKPLLLPEAIDPVSSWNHYRFGVARRRR